MNILECVAKFAGIDERRALGFPPCKLDPKWKDFVPRRYGSDFFLYFENEKRLVYYEFFQYDQVYYETITNIRLLDTEENLWKGLENSYTRGVMHTTEQTKIYDRITWSIPFRFAGRPITVV
jgi:hypothetical protein